MKINKKLMIWFIIVTLFVSVVGIFSIYSFKTIQNNNDIEEHNTQYLMAIDDMELKVSRIIETNNLSDFNQSLSEINDQKMKLQLLSVNDTSKITEFHKYYDFHEDIQNVNLISDELINIHREKLLQEEVFIKEYASEKDQRYKIRDPLFALNNSKLTENIGFMQYFSKEALYQYRDQKHLDEWLQSIDDVRKKVEFLNLPEKEKKNFTKSIEAYKRTAQTMGQIAIRQKEIETQERIKIGILQEILSRLNNAKIEMERRKIELIVKPTAEAVVIFNEEMAKREKRVIGLFHLTC